MANNETMNPDLLLKYLDNEASDQEMREVLAWLEADPANRLELDRLDRAIAASIIHGPLRPHRVPRHLHRRPKGQDVASPCAASSVTRPNWPPCCLSASSCRGR